MKKSLNMSVNVNERIPKRQNEGVGKDALLVSTAQAGEVPAPREAACRGLTRGCPWLFPALL